MASLRMSLSRAMSAASAVRFFSASCRGGLLSSSSGLVCCTASATTVRIARTNFFGCTQRLQCVTATPSKLWNPSRSLGARAKIKRKKEAAFDNVVQREKKVRIVNKIKEILVKQPGRTMTLLQLGKHRKEFGLTGRRRVVALLNRYPAVFEVYEQGCNVLYVRFTEEAEAQYEEEMRLKEELEVFHVEKLRKLLMMSVDKRLTIDKISHIKHDLGIPEDFKTSVVPKYPQYFKLVETETGPALELTFWDPLLAVTVAQKTEAAEANKVDDRPRIIIDGEELVSSQLSNRKLNLPKGLNLSKRDRVVALRFQQIPYVSPYSDATGLDPASVEAEKRACATVHELLSLTLEKKTLVDHLTHFKKDYKFSQRIRALLIRHPEMFYVSFKGHRDSVFLREAYQGSELIDKDPLVLARERLSELVHARIKASEDAGEEGDEEEEEDEDGDGDFDDDDDDDEDEGESDDEWSDKEERQRDEEEKIPVRSYAPSPLKQVQRYKDLRPRPMDSAVRRREVPTIERPRERW
ncbi:unnamed protein product [Calypogeia fissa]